MPTLLSVLGLEAPPGLDGVDLSGHLTGAGGPVIDEALLQGMGHTWLWLDGFEWRGLRGKRFTYAVQRSDGTDFLFDNLGDPLQIANLAGREAFEDVRSGMRERLLARMREIGDEFRPCTWYERHWVDQRVVLRGARD